MADYRVKLTLKTDPTHMPSYSSHFTIQGSVTNAAEILGFRGV